MAEFFVALHAIEIVAGENDIIVLDEAGVLVNAVISPGTYFLRGDGAAGDLCLAIYNALNAAFPSANVYNVSLEDAVGVDSWTITPSAVSAIVRVRLLAGAVAFRVRWLNASTTFPSALLGFAVEKGAPSTASELSTLSPSAVWVHNDRHIDLLPNMVSSRAEVEMRNGGLEAVTRGGVSHTRRLLLELVDGRRLWPHRSASDPSKAWGTFWSTVIDGRRMELHEPDLVVGSATRIGPLSLATRVVQDTAVVEWVISGDSAEGIGATRVRSGMDHWDLEILFHGYVAP